MQATAKDLRFHSKELLNTVRRGEEVVKPIAGSPVPSSYPSGMKKKQPLNPTNYLASGKMTFKQKM
jgi:antitoxin (DNA-binding transcriptional repressor) of toxin-antitoxin stability system